MNSIILKLRPVISYDLAFMNHILRGCAILNAVMKLTPPNHFAHPTICMLSVLFVHLVTFLETVDVLSLLDQEALSSIPSSPPFVEAVRDLASSRLSSSFHSHRSVQFHPRWAFTEALQDSKTNRWSPWHITRSTRINGELWYPLISRFLNTSTQGAWAHKCTRCETI